MNMLPSINFVVGIHVGIEKTALVGMDIRSEHEKKNAFKIEVDGKSDFVTAISYHPEHGVLIGEPALTADGVTESHHEFKQRPTDDPTYQKIMRDYLGHIHQRIKESKHGFADENTLFVISCPADYFRDKAFISAYGDTVKYAGMRRAMVAAEPCAALMNGIESGDVAATVGELRGRALVVDVGSSTTDFTFIDLQKRRLDPLDFGHDLGDSLIDKLILRHVLNTHKQKDKVILILKEFSFMRNRCEFACRHVKESWFNNRSGTPDESVEIIPDELYFSARIKREVMEPILDEPLTDLKDLEPMYGRMFQHLPQTNWLQEFEALLQRAKESGGEPGIILLTGGGSRMYFIVPSCEKIFSKAEIIRGMEPEYSIARGLAYLGQDFILTQRHDSIWNEENAGYLYLCNSLKDAEDKTITHPTPDSINFVVGIHVGIEKTTLMGVNLKSEHKKEGAFKIEVAGKSNFVTAIGYHPEHGVLIGERALTTDGVTESHFAFKQRPTDDSTYQKIMRDYVGYIHQRIKESKHGFTDENTLFVISCPTDWAKDKNLVAAYEAIFEGAGMRLAKVAPESRGALLNGIESGDILATTGELRGRALVVDVNSYTTDFTFIDIQKPRDDPLDFGHDLGSSLIDKLILRHALNTHKQKEKVISIFKEFPFMRNKCEFACREAKEIWFNNTSRTPSQPVEIIPDELYFYARIKKEVMEPILDEPLTDLKDLEPIYGQMFQHLPQTNWLQEFEALLQRAKESGGEPDIILLTGGGSRMYFIAPSCEKIFPEAKIIRGMEPEYSIATGLAYWGRVDIRSQGFVEAVERVLDEQLEPAIEKELPPLFEKLVEDLTDDAISKVVRPTITAWQQTSESVAILKQNLKNKTEQWEKSRAVKNHVNSVLADSLSQVAINLNEDYLIQIAERYDIPNPTGALDASKAVGAIFRGDIKARGATDIIDQRDFEKNFDGMIEKSEMPEFAKKKIDVDGKLREKRPEIISEIKTQLEKNPDLRNWFVSSCRQTIQRAVKMEVDGVRLFID